MQSHDDFRRSFDARRSSFDESFGKAERRMRVFGGIFVVVWAILFYSIIGVGGFALWWLLAHGIDGFAAALGGWVGTFLSAMEKK